MEHIAISVIVPVYNTKPFLRECVQSILDQKETFPENYEVILVDDGATDGCAELCDELAAQDARIRVIHQENQGLSGARNTGIDAAVGRYYAFVDSDDILRPGYLKKLYDACEAHDAYMAICAVEDVAENGASLDPPSYTDPTATGVFVGKELLNNFYSPNGTYYTVAWNKLYRAEVWKLLHYPEGRLHEDDFIAHRLFWRCDRVVCLADHLYCYRLSSGSICRSDLKPEAFDAVDGLADRYRFFVENGANRTVIDCAYAACWRRYLFLCAKVRQNPTPKLIKAISKEQFLMQGLLSYLPNCKQLKMTEKLSAARWAMMPAESLCPMKN
ncbi:MAG TPA: glycosyltransferase [Candidatus Gemmiger stercoripullorum]|nr:glycosyltransferase [Candidatus Gemmiger stercoripullorum]